VISNFQVIIAKKKTCFQEGVELYKGDFGCFENTSFQLQSQIPRHSFSCKNPWVTQWWIFQQARCDFPTIYGTKTGTFLQFAIENGHLVC